MRYRRRATWAQKIMLALMVIAYAALLGWSWIEIRGIASVNPEDTWSELIWDLPLWLFVPSVALHLIPGILFTWAAVHFIEGYVRRRRAEKAAAETMRSWRETP